MLWIPEALPQITRSFPTSVFTDAVTLQMA